MPQNTSSGGSQAAPVEQISPELLEELGDLEAQEQALVARLIKRAKYDGDRRVTINDLSIVAEFLKIDLEYDDFSAFQTTAVAKAPPVIKTYPHCEQIPLPTNYVPVEFSVREVISKRASRRDFSKAPLTLAELSTLLHRSYGIRKRILAYNTRSFPARFAPSSGGLQCVEIYLTVNAVESLEKGLYHYNPAGHSLHVLGRGNFRRKVLQCCTFQEWLDAASVVFFLTCDMSKLYWKYGRRSYRFSHMDVGIVAENLHLVATALRIRSCMVAGYIDDAIHDLLQIDGRNEFIGLLLGVGRKPWDQACPLHGNSKSAPTKK
jgi:SagB-type dehydrogenase family enzyme